MDSGVKYFVGVIVFTVIIAGIGFAMKKNNVTYFTATNVNTLVYSKDHRTGICYAQGSSLLATVPCEKVQHLLD